MVLESLIKGFKTAINVIKVLTINTAKSSKDVMKVIIVFTNQYCSDCHGFQDCYYSYRISLAMQACFKVIFVGKKSVECNGSENVPTILSEVM